MSSSRVILKGLELDEIRHAITVLETMSREAMPDDSFEVLKLGETLKLLRRIEQQLACPLRVVASS